MSTRNANFLAAFYLACEQTLRMSHIKERKEEKEPAHTALNFESVRPHLDAK